MSKIQARARVQILIEVDAGQPWGDDCAIGQLYKQATESGLQVLRNAIKGAGDPIRVIGEPKVISIITERNP